MNKIYTLHFDFNADSRADFFKNVSDFINNIDELNTALCSYIDSEITTKVILEQVGDGSLKAKVKDVLKSVDTDKLRSYVKDPRDAIADFLIKAKDKLIVWLDDEPKQPTNKADEIVCQALEATDLKPCGYKNNKTALLKALSNLSQSTKGFKVPPRINLNGNEREIKGGYEFSPDNLDDIITQKSQFQGSFIIRKPDLAGASKWTIIHGKAIDVKIIDEAWINKLKSHEIALRYGDKTSGTLITNSFIDKDLNVIDTEYFLDDILGVSSSNEPTQPNLDLKD
ncbi:hypothetical protein CR66_01560 [Campylobacter mucosalis]|uniref:hypothetical protein n=1 Tax=Campylobacter mucosalis TaxID=202 RepID=UPI0004D4DE80|nr:hypothetical protein [Campylobacter mucosalis]KEA46553.1 hypothetical protein CR66_01560 [Campylobacter mucosalis]QKF62943.1 hypothetical protein CMCT_0804 [Campylobacter mucosalis]